MYKHALTSGYDWDKIALYPRGGPKSMEVAGDNEARGAFCSKNAPLKI